MEYIKNLLKDIEKYSNSTIQGIRDTETGMIKYYLKNQYSKICNNYIEEKINYKINNISNNKTNIIQDINKNEKISNTKEYFYKNLKNYITTSKKLNIEYKDFIKYGKNLYYSNLTLYKNKFSIDDIYLKNSYYKIKKEIYQTNIENYNKSNNEKYFCIYIIIKQIISKDKKIINHKPMIFFTDFDIKQLIAISHLLVDGIFMYPTGFYQTLIIMYFDVITAKMIPVIFLIINNKTEEIHRCIYIY